MYYPEVSEPDHSIRLINHILGNAVITLIASQEDVSPQALFRQLNDMLNRETTMPRRSATMAAMLRVKTVCLRR